MVKISETKYVLQVKTYRLTEIGKCNVMEINVERSKVMIISRHPSPVQI
jgi:UDP-glucose 6-dehydrogenase